MIDCYNNKNTDYYIDENYVAHPNNLYTVLRCMGIDEPGAIGKNEIDINGDIVIFNSYKDVLWKPAVPLEYISVTYNLKSEENGQ